MSEKYRCNRSFNDLFSLSTNAALGLRESVYGCILCFSIIIRFKSGLRVKNSFPRSDAKNGTLNGIELKISSKASLVSSARLVFKALVQA